VKIIRPYAKMMGPAADQGRIILEFTKSDGIDLLKRIEWCGRISHRSEEEQEADTYDRLLRAVVLKHGDWSIVEHATVSVDCVTDRGITHEIVRHRLFGYTQESTRFVNYEKKMPPSFIYPQPEVECSYCLLGDDLDNDGTIRYRHLLGPEHDLTVVDCPYDPIWIHAIHTSEMQYRNLLAKKWRPQEARSVFPNALASRIIITGNLRNWRHFFLMRTTKQAHPQMRQIMIPLLKEFQEKIPILFEDIEPMANQSDNIAKGR
jgi:thymidylate synthase (FAD)